MKILTVIGARPQFIKAAAVTHAFAQHNTIQEILLHTGQHFDNNMSEVFFEELGIPKPAYNLGIGGGLHGAMTGMQLAGIEEVLLQEKPDWVLVYGDTNSTLAGALAAAKLHIPVAHVEAGLRSFNRKMPEEINRVVTDHISTVLFAPTTTALQNLKQEGIPDEKCHLVGDVMFDAALLFGEKAKQHSQVLNKLGITAKNYLLATIHRAENTNDLQRLTVIVESLNEVSEQQTIIWPIHPRTRKILTHTNLLDKISQSIQLIEPVGYLDMVMLEQNASVIVTDSGGVQKEAFFYEVPCVTLRDETEWVELVESGWNKLISPVSTSTVIDNILGALNTKGRLIQPYGTGSTAQTISSKLLNS